MYIPSNCPVDTFKQYCIEIENLRLNFPEYTFIIVGDFNLHGIKWYNINHTILTGPSSSNSKVLLILLLLNICFSTILSKIIKKYFRLSNFG